MKRRLVYFLKLLALVSLTAYLSSSGVLKAQSDSKAIEITDKDGKSTIFYESSHALVIWVGDYQHWSRLNNVEVEARQVVNALEQRGFKVTTVGNPTGEDLRNAIKDFIDNYGYNPDNRLVIFFTGHGHTRNQTKGYLVPVDAPDR
ncbi:MAG: caspase family protein [Pleurocapsa sp. MO_226.B13]|nr:caspase family protein [Pleurocapsa sp. MO_226.B13]